MQTISDLQTLSQDSLSNATVFPHNTPPANNWFFKIWARMNGIKSYRQCELQWIIKPIVYCKICRKETPKLKTKQKLLKFCNKTTLTKRTYKTNFQKEFSKITLQKELSLEIKYRQAFLIKHQTKTLIKTAADSFKNILHPKPVSISRRND